MMKTDIVSYESAPDRVLMNGKGSYLDPLAPTHISFSVTQGTE